LRDSCAALAVALSPGRTSSTIKESRSSLMRSFPGVSFSHV
jgi:hypothetical protein